MSVPHPVLLPRDAPTVTPHIPRHEPARVGLKVKEKLPEGAAKADGRGGMDRCMDRWMDRWKERGREGGRKRRRKGRKENGWMDRRTDTGILRDAVILGTAQEREGPPRPLCWKDPTFTLMFASSSPCQHLLKAQSSPGGGFPILPICLLQGAGTTSLL